MKKTLFLVFLALLGFGAIANPILVKYKLPMYIGPDKYNEFNVVVPVRLFTPVELSNEALGNIPGATFIKQLVKYAHDENSVKHLINQSRPSPFSDTDFKFLLPNLKWITNASSLKVVGQTKVGRFVFFLLLEQNGKDKKFRTFTLMKTAKGYGLPDLAEDHYTFLLPSYALIRSIDKEPLPSQSKLSKDSNCIFRNSNSTEDCALYLEAKIHRYSLEGSSSQILHHMLTEAHKLSGVDDKRLNKFFSSNYNQHEFGPSQKFQYLQRLLHFAPVLSIEFDSTMVAYFGSIEGSQTKVSLMVRLQKSESGLKIAEPINFNFVDQALSDPLFINTLMRK